MFGPWKVEGGIVGEAMGRQEGTKGGRQWHIIKNAKKIPITEGPFTSWDECRYFVKRWIESGRKVENEGAPHLDFIFSCTFDFTR